jgi:hypothetical protein
MIEIFNRNTQKKIIPQEPLYKSKAICKTNFTDGRKNYLTCPFEGLFEQEPPALLEEPQ